MWKLSTLYKQINLVIISKNIYNNYSFVLNLNKADLYIYLKYITCKRIKQTFNMLEINFKKIVSAANIINQWGFT